MTVMTAVRRKRVVLKGDDRERARKLAAALYCDPIRPASLDDVVRALAATPVVSGADGVQVGVIVTRNTARALLVEADVEIEPRGVKRTWRQGART